MKAIDNKRVMAKSELSWLRGYVQGLLIFDGREIIISDPIAIQKNIEERIDKVIKLLDL